ncbi:Choline dehydrogenase, mitochondrial [Leucoagaricus sp. SymC.cos]|nr:Choline dehydrogenase, mitochondrial [Leucoagaricus sp. SymC.cos]
MLFGRVKYHTLLAFVLLAVTPSFGVVFFENPKDLPQDVEYDFIVAGGGNAGGVVAGRLAENPHWNVLVIEAGPSNQDVPATRTPGLILEVVGTRVDWNYTVVPQSGINGRTTTYSRGKLLGGCSSHNGMGYTRGAKDDWDKWAENVGDESLSWENMLPLMFKSEHLVADSQHRPQQGRLIPSLHGHDGNVFVSAGYTDHPMNEMLLQVTKELEDEFPFVEDVNDGKPVGIAWAQFSIDSNAERSSSATAYVGTSHDNLHVLLNTYVTRVVPVDNGTDFRGVEFATDAQSERKQLIAEKEIIVSGGVIGSPQILLNSGIGRREDLEAVGIKTLVDNPSVGKNFSDQVYTVAIFNTTLPLTDYDLDTALAEWSANRTGPLAFPGPLENQIAFVRLPDTAPPFSEQGFKDPSPGPTAPHIEIYTAQVTKNVPEWNGQAIVPPDLNLSTLQMAVTNLHPVSRGSVTLNSSNPFQYPTIDVGLLTSQVDVSILREGLKSARRLFSAPVFTSSVFNSLFPAGNITTDEDLDAFVRDTAGPYLHGCCSNMMSPRGAKWGVVDPDFRVKGTKGLRVVDASVFVGGF